MKSLDVYLHEELAGRLSRREHAQLSFEYDRGWIEKGGVPLSASLPLKHEPYEDRECRPYFAGLLPEGTFLKDIAKAFAVSSGNSFSILEAIGGECAGAISLVSEGTGLPAPSAPRWMAADELLGMFEMLPTRPLALLEEVEGLRLSLAGAQEKLPVLFHGNKIGITRGDPPSGHIMKIPDSRLPGLVANEGYCMNIAFQLGIQAASVRTWAIGSTHEPGTMEFLLVTRYDREPRSSATTMRLHQEDFCQALGVVSENKYESDGGPGLKDCGELLVGVSSVPARDRQHLVRAVLFNFLIGNNDAHGKNFSILREGPGTPRMAPLYDLVSKVSFPGLSRRMAMKIGGENRPDYVRTRHWERFAAELGISFGAVKQELTKILSQVDRAKASAKESIGAGFSSQPIVSTIDDVIEKRSVWLRDELL